MNGEASFDEAWGLYPKRAGSNPRKDALHAWNARRAEGVTAAEMVAGLKRYAAFIRATDREGTEYVMQARRFFGPSECFRDDYAPPRKPQTNGGGIHLAAAELLAREPDRAPQKTRMQIEHEQRTRLRAVNGGA